MTEYLITIYHKGTQIINGNDIVSTPCSIITTNTESIVMELKMKGITNYTIYPPPPCSLSYSGSTIYGLAGEALSFGDVCYFKSDGKFYKADADTEETTKGLCVICIETTLAINKNGYFLAIGKENYLRKQDIDHLFDIMKKNLRKWWDYNTFNIEQIINETINLKLRSKYHG